MEAIPGRIITVSEASPDGTFNNSLITGDVYPGGGTPDGSYKPRAGQLGFELELDERSANAYSNTSVATLHAGWIQYVQLKSDSPVPTLGGVLFADPTAMQNGTFVVTADPTNAGLPVGISIISAWAAGRYWWMYTGGIVGARSLAAFGGLAAAVGGAMRAITDGGSPARGRMDTMDITSVTTFANSQRSIIGRAVVLPVVNTVTLINLTTRYTNRLT